MPRYEIYEHAGEVDYAVWKGNGIEVPVFDKDGTLTHANSDAFVTDVVDGLRANLVDVFPAIAIISNNHDTKQVKIVSGWLEAELGIEVFGICRADGYPPKPDASMGLEVAKRFGVRPDQIGVVGDRRLTDVGFGKRLGAGAIALCRKAGNGDAAWVPTLRKLESGITGVERLLRVAA